MHKYLICLAFPANLQLKLKAGDHSVQNERFFYFFIFTLSPPVERAAGLRPGEQKTGCMWSLVENWPLSSKLETHNKLLVTRTFL